MLVVDDEDLVRMVAQRSLEHAGFTVLTADGGRAAIEVFKEHHDKIDVVLLDLTMPDLRGDAVYRGMRCIEATVPVIVLSGYSEEHVAECFTEIGPVGFLAKPYTAADLVAKVGAAIATYRADAE